MVVCALTLNARSPTASAWSLTAHKDTLLRIADELLAREVLDADQVKRLAQGLPIDDKAAPPAVAASTDTPRAEKTDKRPGMVAPLTNPVTQE